MLPSSDGHGLSQRLRFNQKLVSQLCVFVVSRKRASCVPFNRHKAMGSALRETDALTADCRSSRFVHFAKYRKAVFRSTVLIACVAFMLYGLTEAESLWGEKEEHGKTQQSCTLQFNRRSGLLECHELVEIKVEGHGDQLDGKIKCEIDKISCFSDGEKEKSGRAKFEVKEGELKIHVNEEKQNVVKTENGNLFAEIDPGQNKVKVTCDEDQGVPKVTVLQVFCTGVNT